MKRFFGRIEIRNGCLHLTVKVEMYAYIFIYILSNGAANYMNITVHIVMKYGVLMPEMLSEQYD